MFEDALAFIREQFGTDAFIPLHEPRFNGREKEYLNECIDSTFVSSVGKFVDRFEEDFAAFTGAKYAVATVNGTAALHTALLVTGVKPGDEVITQPLTFIATANAISYCGASPVFIDVDRDTLGLSPTAVKDYLDEHVIQTEAGPVNKTSGKKISACVPMHTFGHPCRIDELVEICAAYTIPVVEDAAESLGSFFKGRHTGTFGQTGVFSFNGNKTITSGGGGILVTNDEALAGKAKHLTTTAKVPHAWEFEHDQIGYNYRMPNINAALACAQLEQLDEILQQKRALAAAYRDFFPTIGMQFIDEPHHASSNFWLNALLLNDRTERDAFLSVSNEHQIMTRPIWKLMNGLSMFKNCTAGPLENAAWLEDRIVNIPSSVKKK